MEGKGVRLGDLKGVNIYMYITNIIIIIIIIITKKKKKKKKKKSKAL